MAREVEQVTIDGQKYTIGMYPATKSFKLFTKVARKLSPIMGAGGMEGVASGNILDMDTSQMGSMFGPLLANLDDDDTMELITKLLEPVIYNGASSGFEEDDLSTKGHVSKMVDAHFTGNVFLMLKVTFYAMKHNFSDFLPGISSLQGLAKTMGIKIPTL